MKPIADIRRANLELLVTQFGTLDALAARAETSSVYLSQIRNRALDAKTGRPREMGTAMATRLTAAAGKAPGWMDTDHSEGMAGELSDDESELLRVYRLLNDTARVKVGSFADGLLAAGGDDDRAMFSRAQRGDSSRKPKRAA